MIAQTTAQKLQAIVDAKKHIRQAIGNKGVDIAESTPLGEYGNKILSITNNDGAWITDPTKINWLIYMHSSDGTYPTISAPIDVDWGDGSVYSTTHTYSADGYYTITAPIDILNIEQGGEFMDGRMLWWVATFGVNTYIPNNPAISELGAEGQYAPSSMMPIWAPHGLFLPINLTSINSKLNFTSLSPRSVIIIRSSTIVAISSSYQFDGCLFIVPESLYEAYKVADQWSNISSSIFPDVDWVRKRFGIVEYTLPPIMEQ